MNSRLLTTFLVATSLATASGQADSTSAPPSPTALDNAKVTLPYGELQRLWKAAHAPSAKGQEETFIPPVNVSVSSGHYQLDLSADPPRLTATWNLHQFSKDWQLIPLIGGDMHLQSAAPEDASVLYQKHRFTLLKRETGVYEIQLVFTLSESQLHSENGVTFTTIDAASHRLEVIGVPTNRTFSVEGVTPTKGMIYALPSEEGVYTWKLRDEKTKTEEAPPSQWHSQSETIVRLEDQRLQSASRVHLTASDGNGRTATLRLPLEATDIEIKGRDLESWQFGEVEATQRLLKLQWKTPNILNRVVQCHHALTLPPFQAQWPLVAPSTEETSRNVFVIARPSAMDLTGEGLVSPAPIARLTPWLREQAGEMVVDLIERDGSAAASIEAQWQAPQAAAAPIIPTATFTSRLVADGSLIVAAEYVIRHESAVEWTVNLPEQTEILEASVNTISTSPTTTEDGNLAFKLEQEESGTSKVRFSYTAKLGALDPVAGSLTLSLPQTMRFIDKLTWALTLPTAYEIEAIDGNLERASTNPQAETTLCLIKELCRNERPAIEVYYRRQGIDQ